MAIDSADKRRSASGVAFLPLGPGVTPDSTKPEAWRQQAGWGYSGIPTGPFVGTGQIVTAVWLALAGDRGWLADGRL